MIFYFILGCVTLENCTLEPLFRLDNIAFVIWFEPSNMDLIDPVTQYKTGTIAEFNPKINLVDNEALGIIPLARLVSVWLALV